MEHVHLAGAYSGINCLQSDSLTCPYIFPNHSKDGSQLKLIDLKDVEIPFDAMGLCFIKDHKSERNYLFFGSAYGVYRVELSPDGTKQATHHTFELVAGKHEGVGVGNGYEGTMQQLNLFLLPIEEGLYV